MQATKTVDQRLEALARDQKDLFSQIALQVLIYILENRVQFLITYLDRNIVVLRRSIVAEAQEVKDFHEVLSAANKGKSLQPHINRCIAMLNLTDHATYLDRRLK